ncbi:MFS transporter [Phenylobacterium montanum]|uniref:MFS transporter n=1 Tax=Phenylobacterium montanum TaxID=2823693 RepID=A0A975IV80_9CAUL|nr:MFS transporter [Caulobacter sp. S6]QUD88563.1 MFS transporter [Caulobacter sp. S6]
MSAFRAFAVSNLGKNLAFWGGCAAVAVGVGLHIPMFLACASMNYEMAGMQMDLGMQIGMGLIIGGTLVAGFGLLPPPGDHVAKGHDLVVETDEAVKLNREHIALMITLAIALIVDTMKPATLGFVAQGVTKEYGITKAAEAMLPFVALVGTVVGSLVWGVLADRYGRRATILLAAIMFMGTAICGAMPSFVWNLVMCFMMGASAGGLMPIAYTLLAETIPARHRGWALVLVGGVGLVGGYLAASGASSLLIGHFGWRILWFLNLPTGAILIFLKRFVPESPKFLILHGRREEARAVLARFGSTLRDVVIGAGAAPARHQGLPLGVWGVTCALTVTGLAWGLINFGLLLWLPADLQAKGYSAAVASHLIAVSSFIALPTVGVAALIYSRWSTKGALIAMLIVSALGLAGILRLETGAHTGLFATPVLPIALLIVGANGVIAVLLPYSAETYPLHVRGRGSGWVASASKAGGLIAQGLSLAALAPPLGVAAWMIAAPVAASAVLVGVFGRETRGRALADTGADGLEVLETA